MKSPIAKSTLRALRYAVVVGAGLATVPACGQGPAGRGVEPVTEAASGRFELFEGEDGQHYFQLLAKNGEQLLRSEGYVARSGAVNGMESVKENAADAGAFELLEASDGSFYFNLVAANHEIIATSSELYVSKQSAERGIEATQRAAEGADVAELGASGPKLSVFEGEDGQHYFHLRAANGEIILSSEGYASKSGAEDGVVAVKKYATTPDSFTVLEASGEAESQYYFVVEADNGEVIGVGELYGSKYGAERGAETVRRVVREITDTPPTDAEVRVALETAAEGALYISEADYPYSWVHATLDGETAVTEQLVRDTMAPYVDGDPEADGPLAELYAMEGDLSVTDPAECYDDGLSDYGTEQCVKEAAIEAAVEANLRDVHVFYFGAHGSPGAVDGVGVSLFIVGITPEGNLAGLRTLAIWT